MVKDDFDTFAQMLDDCYALLGRQNMPTQTAKAMFFRAMKDHSIQTVAHAFEAHIKDPIRGKFPPSPSDLIAQIDGFVADDGRPGPEEAWALTIRAFDESETVVWTDEMAKAMEIAQPIMQMGDEVGARMAFKESYTRQVDDARKSRVAPKWSVSLGHDSRKRHASIVKAETLGLVAPGSALLLAPPDADSGSLSLLLLTIAPGVDAVAHNFPIIHSNHYY